MSLMIMAVSLASCETIRVSEFCKEAPVIEFSPRDTAETKYDVIAYESFRQKYCK